MFKNKVPTYMTAVLNDGKLLMTPDVSREFVAGTIDDLAEGKAVTVPYVEDNRLYVVAADKVDYIYFDFEDEDEDGD